MDAQTTLTMRCTKCGALAQAACHCGAPYAYISPGKLAAKAVKDNPGISNRAIADELGISLDTVNRARNSTERNRSVDERRIGRDNKKRRMPSGRSKKKTITPEKEAEAASKYLEEGKTRQQVANETGIGTGSISAIVEKERARKEILDSLLDAAAAKNFSEKGALKIEDAIRIHKARLSKAFEQQVNEEVKKRIAAADDATRKHNKELSQENLRLGTMLNQRGVFTERQFSQLLMCIHPDNTASVAVRNEMLQLLVANKRRLVKA